MYRVCCIIKYSLMFCKPNYQITEFSGHLDDITDYIFLHDVYVVRLNIIDILDMIFCANIC